MFVNWWLHTKKWFLYECLSLYIYLYVHMFIFSAGNFRKWMVTLLILYLQAGNIRMLETVFMVIMFTFFWCHGHNFPSLYSDCRDHSFPFWLKEGISPPWKIKGLIYLYKYGGREFEGNKELERNNIRKQIRVCLPLLSQNKMLSKKFLIGALICIVSSNDH